MLRRVRRAAQAELRAWAARAPLRPRTVMYESFAGNGVLDNPEAMFREIIRSPDLSDIRHIWVLAGAGHDEIRREFAHDRRVRFVKYRSGRYFRALATSGYLINNATFPIEFSKRPGQVYVNTWHGTPLKKMGYDMPGGAVDSANTVRNFVAADYLLSQNHFMTEQMYESAYKLRGAFRGRIVEEGYPRVDRQFLDRGCFLAAHARLEEAGIQLDGRNIVLYAPTWKGDSFANPEDDANALLATVSELQDRLGSSEYMVLLKTHQVVHRFAASQPELKSILVPNDIPTNTILGLASQLITDYSSIFFDFLATGLPIIFYTPDAAEYTGSRGTYFAPDELPGPVVSQLAQVADQIARSAGDGTPVVPHPNYEVWKERFVAREDGGASRRVVDVIFRGHTDLRRVFRISDDARTRVLLHLGGMRSNGITSSALNLLTAIDHDSVDVSIVIQRPRSADQRANQARIDPRIRQFHRSGGMNGHKLPHFRRETAERRGLPDLHHTVPGQAALWADEWRRTFGDMSFDVVADFSGYSSFWATLLLHSPGAERLIWLHNDMAAEEHRVIKGRRRMRRSLPAVFALYSQYDRLVSVSPSLAAVNRRSLERRYTLDPSVFVTSRNLIDSARILSMAADDLEQSVTTIDADGASHTPPWLGEFTRPRDGRWFVTVGRYSTEKNHARLIDSFAALHATAPEARLLIIGYGPLESALQKQIDHLGLSSSVFLVGHLANPVPVMAAADCFVLSSNYEGQPMVLLEAATLRLPIVSVRFASITDALPPGEIHIVDQDSAALALGMAEYLHGQVQPARLDARQYNALALAEFTDAMNITPVHFTAAA
ncbi:glycosyltransferase [Lacisediminihabitans changchengi]|uniref:CDP-glycerol glycerophosphotransferase family protein n=1 Tax=Lacisediminihabitans changchengi TaxID=2787634 RepID=A0A934W434_9MICO|nr:glycosyltransferase [Lacisediminihabitans changchengi]MBK4346993.1 CDP-glycerol glycerophosphotransferase family protein [Lacisediminihabitans changchengi]MBK4347884.1 CDP-glycerol glycerophosphotransferase family protein [Lacisediminihabitans changchengi]